MPAQSDTTDIRRRILEAAIPLFARLGYGSASVRELAEAAGVTKPTLYYHFGNKEGLYVAAVESALDLFHQEVRLAAEMPGTARQRIGHVIAAQTSQAAANPDAFRLLLTAEYPSDEGQPQVDLMSYHLRAAEVLHGILDRAAAAGELRQGVSTDAAVLALIGIVGTYCQARLYGFEMPDDTPRQLAEIFFDGVAK